MAYPIFSPVYSIFSSILFFPYHLRLGAWLVYLFSSLNGGMARTAIQVHAINLIELGKGNSGSPFQTSRACKLLTGSPTTKGWTAIGGYPKLASYDMLGKQLRYSKPVKHR